MNHKMREMNPHIMEIYVHKKKWNWHINGKVILLSKRVNLMSAMRKELQRILNKEEVKNIDVFQYGISITIENKEIEINANDKPIVKIIPKENNTEEN